MPLVSFEGIEVELPTNLDGIHFSFADGRLCVKCNNFSGDIVLSKYLISAFSSPNFITRKRNGPEEGVIQEVQDNCFQKRPRPNFLNDLEQSMLLAQLDSSQRSNAHTSEPDSEMEPLVNQKDKSQNKIDLNTENQIKGKRKRFQKSKSINMPSTLEKELLFERPPIPDEVNGYTHITRTVATKQSTNFSAEWTLVKCTGPTPPERWGHTCTRISDDRIILYGGSNDDEVTLGDLYVYDIRSREWSCPLNCESIPRTWHDAVYLESKHLVLVFGGERVVQNTMEVLSDIMVLDTECFLWYPPAISGVPPAPRSGHTCTVLSSEVVVFGGSRGRSRQNSIHVLDTEKWHWKSIKVEGKPPSARTYHSAVAVSNSIVYFGGNDSEKSFDSVHVLQRKKNNMWCWFHPCVVGTAPCPRTGHSATLLDDSKVLIFGGWDPQDADQTNTQVFADLFVLDTVSWEWKEILTVEQKGPFCGRVGHRAICSSNASEPGGIFMFGGQDAQDKRLGVVHSVRIVF